MNIRPVLTVEPLPSGKTDHIFDIRILLDDCHNLDQLVPHGLKRDVLGNLDSPGNPAGVLFRKEAFGDNDKEEMLATTVAANNPIMIWRWSNDQRRDVS